MRRRHISFEQLDNAFIKIADPDNAQRLADQFARLNLTFPTGGV
jgi:hypothetical protein